MAGGSRIFEGLVFCVQSTDRPSREFLADLRYIQIHGGKANRDPRDPRITHCLVYLPSSRPQPHFTRSFDEPPREPPSDYRDWTCDQLIYYYQLTVPARDTSVVQVEWLYDSVRAGSRLGKADDWGGWKIKAQLGVHPLFRQFNTPDRRSAADYAKDAKDKQGARDSKDVKSIEAPRDKQEVNNAKDVKSTTTVPLAPKAHTPAAKGSCMEKELERSLSPDGDESLWKRATFKKRSIYSFTPSPNPEPTTPPAQAPESTKTDSQSPQSTDMPDKPPPPPVKVVLQTTNLADKANGSDAPRPQKAPAPSTASKCYVPRGSVQITETCIQGVNPKANLTVDALPTQHPTQDPMTPASGSPDAPASLPKLTTPLPGPFASAGAPPTPATPSVSTASQFLAAPLIPKPPPPADPPAPASESGLLAPGCPPVPFRLFLSDGLKPGTHRILGKGQEVPLSAATYVVVSSTASQRKVSGPIPLFACIVDESWLLESFMEGKLQNVREYFVNLDRPKRKNSAPPRSKEAEAEQRPSEPGGETRRPPKRKSSTLSEASESAPRAADADTRRPAKRKSSAVSQPKEPTKPPSEAESEFEPDSETESELSEPLVVATAKRTPMPKKTQSKTPPAKAVDVINVDADKDDDDDESYATSSDEEGEVGEEVAPSEGDMSSVWWLIDELRKWDKKGPVRDVLSKCAQDGLTRARRLYYTYKAFIEKRVPDLRVRKPYTKRAKVA